MARYSRLSNLRELFYDRNPGDARVKVGSEREFASSDNSAQTRQIPVSMESGYTLGGFCPRGLSKIGPVTPKKVRVGTGAKRARNARLLVGTCASRNYACNLMPLLLRKSRPDRGAAIHEKYELGPPKPSPEAPAAGVLPEHRKTRKNQEKHRTKTEKHRKI